MPNTGIPKTTVSEVQIDPPLIFLRRYAVICSHVDAAHNLILSMTELNQQIPEIGTTKSGRPRPPDAIGQWFAHLTLIEQAQIIGKFAVINTNIGYAYEHSFKILLDIEGIEYPESGKDGHNLLKLYRLLPEKLKQKMCELYRSVDRTDLEFEENLSGKPSKRAGANTRNRPTLNGDLEYYQGQGYLHNSRYKYTKVNIEKPIRILFPLRFEELIRKIVEQIIGPCINDSIVR